jgi:general stress protein 26
MSEREVRREIAEYVQDVALGVLAYVRADLTPVQRTFGAFAVAGNDILLATGKHAAKVPEIARHPKVSFFLEKRDQDRRGWKSALYIGAVAAITAEGELKQAVEAIGRRNTYFRDRVARDGAGVFELLRLHTREIRQGIRARRQSYG